MALVCDRSIHYEYTGCALPSDVESTCSSHGLLTQTMNERPRVARKGGKVDGQMSRGNITNLAEQAVRRKRDRVQGHARHIDSLPRRWRARTSVSVVLLESGEASAAKSCTTHGNLPDTRRYVNVNVGGLERAAPLRLPFYRSRNGIGSRSVHRVGPWITIEIGKGYSFLSVSPDLSSFFIVTNRHDLPLIDENRAIWLKW